jgi:hypothetical protein
MTSGLAVNGPVTAGLSLAVLASGFVVYFVWRRIRG